MANSFDTISLLVYNKINAEIKLGDGNPDEAVMGGHVVLNLLYIGGTRKPAHAFRLWVYASAALRQADFEADQGRGLLIASKAPTRIIFTPPVPIPGGGYDHDNDPATPPVLRPVTLAFNIPPAANFVEPSDDPERPGDEPKAITYYMKISILQEDDVVIEPITGYTPGGQPLPFGPALIIVSVLIGTPPGGMTVIFNAIEGWEGDYQFRFGIGDRPGAIGEWLDFLATPDPDSPPERRRLFGVFDRRTLEQYYEGIENLTPGERLEIYLEIQNRYPPDTSPPTGSRINRGRTFFQYPFDVRQPSAPTNLRTGILSTPYSPLSPRIRFLWDFPADLGNVPIGYYEYRYKLSHETYFGNWTNVGTTKDITLTLPQQYDGGELVFEVRGVNNVTTRDPATNNLVDIHGQIASITTRIGPTDPPPPLPPDPDPDPDPEPPPEPDPDPDPDPGPPQLTPSQRLGHIKNTDNWTRIGRGGKVYSYVDGGSATVRNVPRGVRRVTFVGVPTLKSPLSVDGRTDNVQTIFETALASLTENDQA